MLNQKSFTEQIKNLPVLPQVTMRITERMQSPTATLEEIACLIRSDAGLASKILRLANSSYYSIPGGVSDISKALQYLGFNTIAQIVLTTSVIGSFKNQGSASFPLASFWTHSFAVGLLSEITARQLHFKNPSDAFIGGLIHDIGKLILLEADFESLLKIIHLAKEKKISFLDAEKTLGLVNHIELGMALAQHWHLPEAIRTSIQYHHGGSGHENALLIEWANLWVNANAFGHSGNYQPATAISLHQLETKLHLDEKKLHQIKNTFTKDFEKAGAILNGN